VARPDAADRSASTCRYGENCTNPACPFVHLTVEIPGNIHLIQKCQTLQSTPGNAAALRINCCLHLACLFLSDRSFPCFVAVEEEAVPENQCMYGSKCTDVNCTRVHPETPGVTLVCSYFERPSLFPSFSVYSQSLFQFYERSLSESPFTAWYVFSRLLLPPSPDPKPMLRLYSPDYVLAFLRLSTTSGHPPFPPDDEVQKCRFGSSCTKANCRFTHVEAEESVLLPQHASHSSGHASVPSHGVNAISRSSKFMQFTQGTGEEPEFDDRPVFSSLLQPRKHPPILLANTYTIAAYVLRFRRFCRYAQSRKCDDIAPFSPHIVEGGPDNFEPFSIRQPEGTL
jgi:hypothetical protein